MAELAIIGLVGNILNFVDFAASVARQAREISASSTGTSKSNAEHVGAAEQLKDLAEKIRPAASLSSSTSSQSLASDPELEALCDQCLSIADEMLVLSGKLQAKKAGKVRAAAAAVKTVWNKGEIEGIQRRLADIRQQVIVHLSVSISVQLGTLATDQQDNLGALDERVKTGIQEILDSLAAHKIEGSLGLNLLLEKIQLGFDACEKQQTNDSDAIREDLANLTAMAAAQSVETQTSAQRSVDEMKHFFQIQLQDLSRNLCQLQSQLDSKNTEIRELLLQNQSMQAAQREALTKKGNAIVASIISVSTIYDQLKGFFSNILQEAKQLLTQKEIDEAVAAGQTTPTVSDGAIIFSSSPRQLIRLYSLNVQLGVTTAPVPFTSETSSTRAARDHFKYWIDRIPVQARHCPALDVDIDESMNYVMYGPARMYLFFLTTVVPLIDHMLSADETDTIILTAWSIAMDYIIKGAASMWAAAPRAELTQKRFVGVPRPDSEGWPVTRFQRFKAQMVLQHVAAMRWFAHASGLVDKIRDDLDTGRTVSFEEAKGREQQVSRNELQASLTALLAGLMSTKPPWYVYVKHDLAHVNLVNLKFDWEAWPDCDEGSNWVEIEQDAVDLQSFIYVMKLKTDWFQN